MDIAVVGASIVEGAVRFGIGPLHKASNVHLSTGTVS